MVPNGAQGGASGPSRAGAARSRWWAVGAAVGVLAVAVGALALGWQLSRQPPAGGTADQDAEVDEPPPPDPGYVGPQACAACHGARVAGFLKTRHALACRLPQPEIMPEGFAPGRGTFASRVPGLRFEMAQDGDAFVQTAVRSTAAGEQRTAARIALVYGSGGTADEVYFTWHDDRLYELPMAWLHPLNQWAEEPRSKYGTGDFTRTTTPRCLECHNTWVEHAAGTENQYRRDSFLLGVTCERCHGPGREHVAFHQAHPEAEGGQLIVHPGRLARERQMDVCGQCHSNATTRRGPAFSYRPGEPLEAHFRTALVQHREEDHVADQVKYLRQSKCFQKSDTLTCTTCHNPHRPADAAAVRGACAKCHQPADCGEQPRLPAAVRDNCVDCHMPRFTRIQVLFHTANDQYVPAIRPRDHRIAVHPVARQEVLLAWHRSQPDDANRREAARLAGELGEHWLAEAETYRRDYRFLAAIGAAREALRLDPTPAARAKLQEVVALQARIDADRDEAFHLADTGRNPEAIEALEGLLRIKPDLAAAHGKLGTLYAVAGQNERAVEHLEAAARYDPDDPYGPAMLGWLAYLRDRPAEALAAYRRAEEIDPWNAKTNHHTGLALVKLGRWEEAVERFRRALAIDPNHAGACHSLAEALRHQGQPGEALRFARRAARLTYFQNPDVLLTLAETYADAGRFAEARATADQALEVAQTSNPGLVPQIRWRLEAWQARAASKR